MSLNKVNSRCFQFPKKQSPKTCRNKLWFFKLFYIRYFIFFYVHFVGLRRMIRNVASQNKDGIKKKWIFVSSESETPNGIHDKNAKERIFFFFFFTKDECKIRYCVAFDSATLWAEQNSNEKDLRKLVLNWWQDQAQRIIKCDKTKGIQEFKLAFKHFF